MNTQLVWERAVLKNDAMLAELVLATLVNKSDASFET